MLNLFKTRRELLRQSGMGMGSLALTALLGKSLEAAPTLNPLSPKPAPLPFKAKRVLHLFMNGGCSHVDSQSSGGCDDSAGEAASTSHASH